VLDKIASLPINRWSYITERAWRHVGPMAQDFYAAFGVAADDKHSRRSRGRRAVGLRSRRCTRAFGVLDAENASLRAQLALRRRRKPRPICSSIVSSSA